MCQNVQGHHGFACVTGSHFFCQQDAQGRSGLPACPVEFLEE